MGHDEAMACEGRFSQTLRIEGEGAERFHQFAIAPCRHREDELERASALFGEAGQSIDIVEAEQPAIRDENDPLDREALQHARQHGLQGLCLCHVAGMDGVHQGQALCGLHHTHDELTGNAACLFVHAIGADVLLNLALAMDPHCRQIVEDDGEVAVHQRPDLLGKFALHPIGMVHERVHGAQEMVVFHRLRHCGHRDHFQPA